ncbi:peptidase S10 [Acetobacteraceae bacterium KSS8]|uniref:Peptidase S10 n=1 Tax=Endosaccharibacter trunci TaxID=2812733 RepID=A0ABT1W896_9PROT|nr:peptidase S10 [Acetobacteraceae bacterium KSS8]
MTRSLLASLLPLTGALALSAMPAFAAEPPGKSALPAPAAAPAADPQPKIDNAQIALLPADSVTHHTFSAPGGPSIGYTATAGTLILRDDKGAPSAKMFYVSYVADGQGARKRPISFFFNGGPGAGSAFLHLGAAGPVVLNFPTANPTDGANATLAPNPDSWLRFTDMVFIDAVGTGYSRPVDPDKAAKEFYGVKQDGSAFAQAIRLWIERNHRESSNKYLVGESYGGIRSIRTAYALETEQNILLSGIVMVSPAIEMGLLDNNVDPIGNAITLPSLAAGEMERRHTLTPQALDDAYHYAFGPYVSILAGAPPTGDVAKQFYGKIADMTGVPERVVTAQRGMLDVQSHDVRSRDGRLYSLYDDTLSIADPYPSGEDNADSPEPVLAGFGLAYGNAFTGYVGDTLGFHTELKYDLLNLGVNGAWDYKADGEPMARNMPELRKLLALNPSLHVFIAHGMFDLACPFAGTRWLVEHIPVGRDRIRLKLYPGGHMLYTRPDSRAALSHDVAALYAATP